MENIILVGIMGCGKTTISKLLSEKLKMPVIDMDEYIEKKYLLRHRRRYKTHNTNKNRIILDAIKKYFDDKIEISGEKAGLYLVASPKNNMTEEQLVSSALKFGIKVYPISKYYKNISTAPKNSVIIGYSSVLIDNIEKGIALLYKAWFE